MTKSNFKSKSKSAFTLIEIMVVLVIMGFLVSLVAPKLAGIVDGAVDTNCDTNQERLRKVIQTYVVQNNALPNGLTNFVRTDDVNVTAANFGRLSVNDNDKANGAEFFSDDFAERYKPQVHILNAAEAEELVKINQNAVFTAEMVATADITAIGDDAVLTADVLEENVQQPVVAGLGVMMAGVGFSDQGDDSAVWSKGNTITFDANSVVTEDAAQIGINAASATDSRDTTGNFARMDEGRSIGRIILGVSNTNELIHNGLLDESGTCPGEIQNADHFSWGNYVILVPRLAATWDRLTADGTAGTEPVLHALALSVDTGEAADGNTIAGRTPAGGYPYFTAQEVKDFTTSCPEGHTWGAPADSYAVKIAN